MNAFLSENSLYGHRLTIKKARCLLYEPYTSHIRVIYESNMSQI